MILSTCGSRLNSFPRVYRLDTLQRNGLALMQLNESIYGLPQAGILSQQRLLLNHLKTYGYTECDNTSYLFQYQTRHTKFTLVVDDFLVKYDSSNRLGCNVIFRHDYPLFKRVSHSYHIDAVLCYVSSQVSRRY
jgi:hypothetical protein